MKKLTMLAALAACAFNTSGAIAHDETPPGTLSLRARVFTVDSSRRNSTVRARIVRTGGRIGYLLQKTSATNVPASAGVNITGVSGLVGIHELGYDYDPANFKGVLAPKFVVTDSTNATYIFPHTKGTHTTLSDGWNHVTYNHHQTEGASVPHAAVISKVQLILDEGPGVVKVDNLSVDNTIAK